MAALPTGSNLIVASLPRADRLRLLALCEPVQLVQGEVLSEPGQPTRHVHFPTASIVTLIARVDEHPGLEVGMIGREGMLGSHLAQGQVHDPLRAMVQAAGSTLRVAARPFRAELARSRTLGLALDRYLFVLMAQRATSAGCLRYHQIEPRLARWLLMSNDRAQSDRFPVTQVFMAYMLGVRRVGVTRAASALQRRGLIAYHRGEMKVVDRAGLERASCSCYAAERAIYGRVMR